VALPTGSGSNGKEINLAEDFLHEQKQLAERNRRFLDSRGAKMIDLIGSVGTGKTALLEQLAVLLRDHCRLAVINADLATAIDRERIAALGVPAVQLNTGKECHIDAVLVGEELARLDPGPGSVVFVENVGNMICPVDFPLGSHARILVISVTEGPYIALKHPYVFAELQYVVINKIDLAPLLEADVSRLSGDIRSLNPHVRIFPVSCRTGEGLAELLAVLRGVLAGA
jgi:hydrogenase nickel incorporation protein HypB